MYEWMGRAHAWIVQERGQGTVEYVGLVLLLGVILAGVITATNGFNDAEIAKTVVTKLKAAINSVGDTSPGP